MKVPAMTRLTLTLTFLSALALGGCNHAGRQTTCQAYEVGRSAACAACSALPTSCPWTAAGEAGQ